MGKDGEFKGKVAIITGAAQGLGKAVAESFGEEKAVLVLVDVKLEKLQALVNELEKKGIETHSHAYDISNEDQVHSLIETVVGQLKHIDILVNCAGILRTTRFHEMTVKEWDEVMNVNLRGTFLLMREVYPHMKERGDGRIVNFSSTAGLTVSNFGGAHYTTSKHAVMGLTKAVAKEGGPFGIRVNAVCPGIIDTDMVRDTIDDDQSYEKAIPISRLGMPEEVAERVLFLASDRSAYITGIGVNISGGHLL